MGEFMKKNNIGCFGYAIILIIISFIVYYWYLVLALVIISALFFIIYKYYFKKKNKPMKMEKNVGSNNNTSETNKPIKTEIPTVDAHVKPVNTIAYISTEKQKNKPKYKLLFQTKIVGSSFHKANINHAIKDARDFLPLGFYQGTSNKEIKEELFYGDKVYEVCDSDDIGIFHLVKEPDNQYDKNAIAVKIKTFSNDDLTIGYIPKEKTAQCSHFMNDDNPNITYNFHFGGGKYKTLNQDEFGEDKVKIKNSNYWFELSILLKI